MRRDRVDYPTKVRIEQIRELLGPDRSACRKPFGNRCEAGYIGDEHGAATMVRNGSAVGS